MGNMIRNRIMKPIRLFNVESRAEKVISRDKPVPAPKYKSNIEDMERVLKENPNILDDISKKNNPLYDRLKDVYVSSNDIIIEKPISSINSKRPLPIDKRMVKDFEYGMQEPETVTPGMTTIRLALEFITEHNIKPEVANVEYVSKTYNLKPEITENVLHYFKTYEIFIPPELQSNPAFAKALGQHNALKLEISQKLHDLEKKQIDRGETKVLEDKV